MSDYSFRCQLEEDAADSVEELLKCFSASAAKYGFSAFMRTDGVPARGFINVLLTLRMDEDILAARKTGPKMKKTAIPLEEMAALRAQGVPAERIAALAGIAKRTYFQRMAEYDASQEKKHSPSYSN